MNRYKYEDVLPIKSYMSTVWMVEFAAGPRSLQIWHKDAKIEDIVNSVKCFYPDAEFTVSAVDVGSIWVHSVESMLSNGRKLNQNMEVVV